MGAVQYSDLELRIDELARNLLPAVRSEIGDYSIKESDATRAFVLLAHAEIESFLEDLALEAMERARREWVHNNQCTSILSRLVTYQMARSSKDPELLSEKNVRSACNSFTQVVRDNHGVKIRNVLSIFLPLGFSFEDFDPTILLTFDTFGEDRGLIAHKSFKAKQQINPTIEEQRIKEQLLPEVRRIYERVQEISG